MESLLRRAVLAAALGIAAGALPACAAPDASTSPSPTPEMTRLEQREVLLPIEWAGRYAFVRVMADGKGPYWFVLDTGASFTVVDRRVAEAHPGGIRTDTMEARGSEGTVTLSGRIRIESLVAGEAEFTGVEAVVHDFSQLSRLVGHVFDGILSYWTFQGGLLTMDYADLEEGNFLAVEPAPVSPWNPKWSHLFLSPGHRGVIDRKSVV